MDITELDVRKQVRRLLTVYSTAKSEDAVTAAFFHVLGGKLGPVDLMAAVSAYLESPARYMPTPGVLLELARAKMREGGGSYGDAPQREDYALRCPTCGAKLRELGPDDQVWTEWSEDENKFINVLPAATGPRLGILHDYRIHRERGVMIVGGYRR